MGKIKKIYLAGGCFWGVEAYFDRAGGIYSATPGYANGKTDHAEYRTLRETDHAEAVRLVYDSEIISLEYILEYFFRIIDPESVNRQGNDIGRQYRTGIYYEDDEDLQIIQEFMEEKSKEYESIAVEVEKLDHFIVAEDYHIDYLKKNPGGYCHIDLSTKADDHLQDLDLKEILSDQEYKIMVENGTDRAFSHELDDFYEPGLYLDKISKTPLFVSSKKYNAGCGWPSFTEPINKDDIDYLEDNSLFMTRTEIRSKDSDSHLGHVFEDGPEEAGGLRYCINGSALEFIGYDELEDYGLERYRDLIDRQ